MWFYTDVTREQFEQVKDIVEELLIECGAKKIDIDLPYEQKITSYSGKKEVEFILHRAVFDFRNELSF